MISRKDERIREREFFNSLSEGDKTRAVMMKDTGEVLSELRFIRWVLVAIAFAAFVALFKLWPEWWHLPWWPK